MRSFTQRQGFSLVEAVIAAGVALGVVLGVVGAFTLALHASLSNTKKIQASFLGEEGLEAVRILRDNSWTSNIAALTAGTTYYLSYDSAASTWKATTTNAYIDSTFERSFVINTVNRDGSQNIVTSGGSLDSNTKKVTVSVSWRQDSATTTRTLATYITNLFNN